MGTVGHHEVLEMTHKIQFMRVKTLMYQIQIVLLNKKQTHKKSVINEDFAGCL